METYEIPAWLERFLQHRDELLWMVFYFPDEPAPHIYDTSEIEFYN